MGLKLIFMGTPEFAVPILESIYNSKHKLIGVYTQPPKKKKCLHLSIQGNIFFQIVLGPLREVHRAPGSVPSPIPSSPGAKNEVKLRCQKSKKKCPDTKILLSAQGEFNFDLKMLTKWVQIGPFELRIGGSGRAFRDESNGSSHLSN